jgi:hypothetical protein
MAIVDLNRLQNTIKTWHKVLALLLIFGGIIFGCRCLYLQSENSRITGLGLMGVIILSSSLLGMILISYYADLPSGEPKTALFAGGELRTAITISFIFVFFGLLAYSGSILVPTGQNCPCQQPITKSLLDNYWLIISAIIAFYFLDTTLKKKQ